MVPTVTCKPSVSHEAWYWYVILRKRDAAERLEVEPAVIMHALLPREKKAVVEELGAITYVVSHTRSNSSSISTKSFLTAACNRRGLTRLALCGYHCLFLILRSSWWC